MLELAYMSIEGMTEHEREILYRCVAPERREQLKARKNRMSADLSLAAEVLARWMLWKAVMQLEEEHKVQCDCIPDDFPYGGGRPGMIQPKDFVIVRDTDGKPYQETVPGLFFNYSHSGTMVACGIAGENIGVDIQKLSDGTKVCEKVYCPEEMEVVDYGNFVQFFTEVWTKKESYLKLTGEGLRKEMKLLNLKEMQERSVAQWFGGPICNEYYLYACVEGIGSNRIKTLYNKMNDCKSDRTEKKQEGIREMYEVTLQEVVCAVKKIRCL